jgi:hypothetical protein
MLRKGSMVRKIVLLVCVLLIISAMGCSGKKVSKGSDETPSSVDTTVSKTASGNELDNLNEFNESIFDDLKETFAASGMTLASLKRDSKGSLVLAEIKESDSERFVPSAVEILNQNFSSVEKIVIRDVKGKDFSIDVTQLAELVEKNNGQQLYSAIWVAVNTKEEDSRDKSKAKAAGM